MLAVVATVYLLNAAPMQGPYPKAFDCASLRAAGAARCERIEEWPIGRLQLQVWRVEGEEDIVYWIAMGSGDVWWRGGVGGFGHECGMGHCTDVEPKRVVFATRADPEPIATLSIRSEITRTCTECVPRTSTHDTRTVEFACRMAADRTSAECGTPSTSPVPTE